MKLRCFMIGLLEVCLVTNLNLAEESVISLWPVDVHVKVFRNSQPPEKAAFPLVVKAARNEYESAQIAVRSTSEIKKLGFRISELRCQEGNAIFPADNIQMRFVGYIPLKSNTPGAEVIRVAAAPCEIPDPLLEDPEINLPGETTTPVWITFWIPPETAPGVYKGELGLVADDHEVKIPVELHVYPFRLPNERHLLVTNWFNLGNIAKAHQVELWSEPFWTVLTKYAENMARHRQNVVLIPWTLIEVGLQPDGQLIFDYSRFDRFVELFQRAGVADGIEISHVGHPKGGWGGPVELSNVRAKKTDTGEAVTLGYDDGLKPLLADLEQHLERKGWLEKTMIHISDEPSIKNVESWRQASNLVHQAAPRLRRIDAIETIDFDGALEIWVPKLSQWDTWREAFLKRRDRAEFWYYICCHPYGNIYPNRFLDYPTTCVRVLHWINYVEDLKGYLHWGWNFWGEAPFGTPSDRLPPGDTHVIYPGKNGPIDSIRWEIQRESLEDFEYLWLLEQKLADVKKRFGAAAAEFEPRRRVSELARRVVPSLAKTPKTPEVIWTIRDQIASEILALDREPFALVQTEPDDGATLIYGPINLEVRGVVEPGTIVKVNSAKVEVTADGRFGCRASPQGEEGKVHISLEKDGKTKEILRSFSIRRE